MEAIVRTYSVLFVRWQRQLTTYHVRKGGLSSDELSKAELTGDRQQGIHVPFFPWKRQVHSMSTRHYHGPQRTHARQRTSNFAWRQQLLQEELVRLRKDFATVKAILAKEHQELFIAEDAARHLHQTTLQRQVQVVEHLQAVLQTKRRRRRSIYQAEIDRYRSRPCRLFLFASALLGATLPQTLALTDVRDLRRLRDVPDEEEQQLARELQRELRALDVLRSRIAPPETPELRQRREQVRSIQSYLSALHRQIRSKEIELASLQALQKRANQGQP